MFCENVNYFFPIYKLANLFCSMQIDDWSQRNKQVACRNKVTFVTSAMRADIKEVC